MKSLYSVLFLSFLMIGTSSIMTSCTGASKTKVPQPPAADMAELLRRQPHVQVFGNGSNIRVQIRAKKTFLTTSEPLYIIDGIRVGNDYSSISFLNPGDVRRIKVVSNASELAGYGIGSANGVIEIFLNK